MIGVAIQAPDAKQAVEQIIQAEQAGIPAIWATSGGVGHADLIPIWAAAAVKTERIILGTSILRTWSRHPVGLAQEALALEQLASGRLRLGIGPTGKTAAEQIYGGRYDKPLTYLREYLTVVRTLLHEGAIEFEGEYVTARMEFGSQFNTPVLISAAGLRAFELAGELSDGAISWVAPKRYLVEQALPALRRGAAKTGWETPPLIAHVPVVVNEDSAAAHALAREQLDWFAGSPYFTATWAAAGFDPAQGYSDELLNDLLVYGNEETVAAGLIRWLEAGVDEVLVQPLLDPQDRSGSLARAFAAAALAAQRAWYIGQETVD